MRWKPWLTLAGLIASILFIFFYLGNYGFSFPPCSSYEIPLAAPDLMRTSDIVFEKQMYYVIKPHKDKKSFWETCPNNVREDAAGFIQQDNRPYETPGYQIIPIEKDTKFKLIRSTYIHAAIDFEGGKSGEHYLIRDDNGKDWYIRPIYFLNDKRWDNEAEPKWTAGYYKSGQRIGDVIIESENF